MLDLLVPCPIANIPLAPEAIENFIACTDVPFKVIVIVDGGIRRELEGIEDYLAHVEVPWKLLHNPDAVGLNQTLREGLDECTQKLTAIMGPEVRLLDKQWFGKVRQVFERDPVCGIADFTPDTKSATLYPVKRAHNRPPADGCRFAVVQTAFAKKTKIFGGNDPIACWARDASNNGGSAWAIAAVRYTEAQHEEHELFRSIPANG